MMQGHPYPESDFSRMNVSIENQPRVDIDSNYRPNTTDKPFKDKKHSLECDFGTQFEPMGKRLKARISSETAEVLEIDKEQSLCDSKKTFQLDDQILLDKKNAKLKNILETEKRSVKPDKSIDSRAVDITDGTSSENDSSDSRSLLTKKCFNKSSEDVEYPSQNASTYSNEHIIDSSGIEMLATVVGENPRMDTLEIDQSQDSMYNSDNLMGKLSCHVRKARMNFDRVEDMDLVYSEQFMRNIKQQEITHSNTWSKLPLLPIEPELSPTKILVDVNSRSETHRLLLPHEAPLDVKEPLFIHKSLPNLKKIDPSTCDPWYPSNKLILRERKTKGIVDADRKIVAQVTILDNKIPICSSVHDRLNSNMEPGCIEKLPHCKLHEQMYLAQNDENLRKPLFCFQVTELHCQRMMVCCSKCSTWRHVQCGGHFSCSIPRKARKEMSSFYPVCDRCYVEEFILEKYPLATSRIERQRIIHLRKTQAVGSVMRSAAYATYGSQNWPPGSVQLSHLSSHKKSILTRFAKAEKQWNDMLFKLGPQNRSANKLVADRSKEFERILQYLQDSEIKSDLHNAILFLERDTQKEYPTGHETPLFNLFDPEDDSLRISILKEKNGNRNDFHEYSDKEREIRGGEDTLKASEDEKSKDLPILCRRIGCERTPRFNSNFCTDACGILAMESDLLQTLRLADQLHPSNLR
jgi:hypothetical protein